LLAWQVDRVFELIFFETRRDVLGELERIHPVAP
jgi:hypothetical protein